VANLTETNRSKRRGLTSEEIFRVWKAAIKDDEKLLDELIASVHKQMVSLDHAQLRFATRVANGNFSARNGPHVCAHVSRDRHAQVAGIRFG
jgi:hypothetical protein